MKRRIAWIIQGRWSRPGLAAIAVVAALIALSPAAAWHALMQAGRLLSAYVVTGILLALAVLALVDHWRRMGKRKRVVGRWPWLLSDRGIAAVVLVMACVGGGVMAIMLALAHAVDGADRTKLQIDAIKYGLGVIAAAGAAAALLLSVRRQRHTEEDAEAQRVTDIYTAAVEQLGHAEAPVRLGGMYALERLAQANPTQRQTVVNVLCAYLRMPFTPPDSKVLVQAEADEKATGGRSAQGVRDPQQELQVRLTAQRILTQHLRQPEGISTAAQAEAAHPSIKLPFWPNINLDLAGAYLADFDFDRCHARTATFQSATFDGDAAFRDATFFGDAGFHDAAFGGSAWFAGATFGWHAQFGGARFNRYAQFGGARFDGHAQFDEARFSGGAEFGGATFGGDGRFIGAMFGQDSWFRRATFGRGALFRKTTCEGLADFRGATFGGAAWFSEVAFGGGAGFVGARAAAAAAGMHQLPPGWTTQESGDSQWLRLVWASAPSPVDARTTNAEPSGQAVAVPPYGQSSEALSADDDLSTVGGARIAVMLGILKTRPARTRTDLLAPPVAAALDAWPVDADQVLVAPIDAALSDTAAFCEAYEVAPEETVNCVIVAGKREGEVRYAACVVLANTRADVNSVVRKHLGVRKCSFAPMDDAVSATGMEYGGITPIGLPADWSVLVDPRVVAVPHVVIGSGIRGSKIVLPGSALAALPNAEVVPDLAKPIQ